MGRKANISKVDKLVSAQKRQNGSTIGDFAGATLKRDNRTDACLLTAAKAQVRDNSEKTEADSQFAIFSTAVHSAGFTQVSHDFQRQYSAAPTNTVTNPKSSPRTNCIAFSLG